MTPLRLLALVLLVACAGRRPPESWVGLRFHDGLTELPASFSWSGESLVGPTEGGFGVTWGTIGDSDRVVLLLERLVEPEPPLWEVVGATELPPLRDGTMLQTLHCSAGGVPDPWLIAVVPTSPACSDVPAERAFRFVPDRPRLDPVPVDEVSCPSDCDQPGGVLMGVELGD